MDVASTISVTAPSSDVSNRIATTQFVSTAISAIPIATTLVAGIVKPDGTTISVAGDGTISTVIATPTVQRFTSGSANYTPPAGVKWIKVRMPGGGGGGGASVTNPGSAGTDTSFGGWTAIHGNGGVQGVSGNNGGAGGVGGTGGANGTGTLITRVPGATGQGGGLGSARNAPVGGCGGCTPFGGGGGGGPAAGAGSGTGSAASTNSGGGGGGGGGAGGGPGGGGGGSGEYVEFIVPTPGTIAYVVGSGGNGGAAGTNAGGNGAAGQIIVEEFYA